MKILMITHFCDGENESSNNRFNYIYKSLKEAGYDVKLLTSNISHRDKTVRKKSLDSSYIYIQEPLYKKNISLKRFYSHFIFGKNIRKFLNQNDKPDLIYCAIPSLDAGYVAAKFSKKNDIPFVIDIQDLWPEAFEMVFNIPILSKIIFYPMKRKADYIYSVANKIIAVSDTYKNRGLEVNKKDKEGLTVFLGTDLLNLDKQLKKQQITYKKKTNELWVGYLGTLGSSYDIDTSLKAMNHVQKNYPNCKFILLGDGPKRIQFEKLANQLGVNVEFLGRKEYIEAMKILSQCDITLNPIVKNSKASIINKVGDYAALGLPVINSLQNEEYQGLLEEYNAGINIPCENYKAMADSIVFLIKNKKSRIDMGKANRRLAQDLFDRNCTYKKILQLIEEFNKI